MGDISLVYSTIDSQSQAEELCEQLLNEKLIACANIFPLGTSIYKWEGQVERNEEHTMILKTTPEKIEELKSRFAELHPYDIPCFVELATEDSYTPFSQWVMDEINS